VTAPAAAVILAGGRGRRLGGVDKPALRIGEHSLLDIAIDAVSGAVNRPIIVVVGPSRELSRWRPPGCAAVTFPPLGPGRITQRVGDHPPGRVAPMNPFQYICEILT